MDYDDGFAVGAADAAQLRSSGIEAAMSAQRQRTARASANG
jgi:hypothetical protein